MANEWLYIDNIDSLPATDYVHCDTRDFHVLCVNDKECCRSEKIKELKKLSKTPQPDEYKFRRDEILGTLKALELGSGGPGDWRMLRLKPEVRDISWLKYIRFVAVGTVEMCGHDERVYIAYADCCGKQFRLSRADLQPENIDTEHLNHINYPPDKDPRKQEVAISKVVQCETLEDLNKVL